MTQPLPPDAPPKALKRPYLPRTDRRTALLDVAAEVVEKHGWQGLSMISVADAAQVSRQLVYQHFASVDALITATMAHLFGERYASIRDGIAQNSDNLPGLLGLVDRLTFDNNPGKIRALWQMFTSAYSNSEETTRSGVRFRHLITNLWAPLTSREFGLSTEQGRAVAWMMNMAFWGAHQLVHDGEISRGQALELFGWMLTRLRTDEPKADFPAPAETPAASELPTPALANAARRTRRAKSKPE